MPLDPKELAKALKDPEVKKAMKAQDFEEIEVSEEDTIETVAKKFNARLKQMQENFDSTLQTALEESTKESTAKSERDKIKEFTKTHKGMEKKEVIDLMDPLYMSGMTLEDAYAKACKAADINPETGTPVGEEEEESGKKKEDKQKEKPRSSIKSKGSVKPEEDEEEEDDKSEMSLSEVIKANANKLDAKEEYNFDDE